MSGRRGGELHQLAQRVDPRSGQLVRLAEGVPVVERVDEGVRDIADPHGLEAHVGAADRNGGEEAGERGEGVQEAVFRSEDHRRLEDRPVERRGAHHGLAVALAALVHRGTLRVRSERAHVQVPPNAGPGAAGHDPPGQFDVRAGELRSIGRPARSLEDSDEIDDRIVAAQQLIEGVVTADVAFDDLDGRQHDQVTRARSVARGDGRPQSAVDQAGDDVTADEAGSADDEDLVHGCAALRVRRF